MNLPSLDFYDVAAWPVLGGYGATTNPCNQLALVEAKLAAKRKERTSVLLGLDFLRGPKNKAIDAQIESLKGQKANLKKLCKAGVTATGKKFGGGGGGAAAAETAALIPDPALDPALLAASAVAEGGSSMPLIIGAVVVVLLGLGGVLMLGGKSQSKPVSRFGS